MKETSLRDLRMLRAGIVASSFFISASYAQTVAAPSVPIDLAQAPQQVASAMAAAAVAPTLSANAWRARQSLYYKRNWGVEVIGVKPVSSGFMLAFKYRVLDPEKAKLLNDRQTRAFLRDEATGNVLSVPAMEKVGELRTGAAPEADRTYFMIFGNPGRLVKSGSRVSVVAGALHIDGLIVD